MSALAVKRNGPVETASSEEQGRDGGQEEGCECDAFGIGGSS